MKCINKKFYGLLCLICTAAIFISGCGQEVSINNPIDKYSTVADTNNSKDYFSKNLCVTDTTNFGQESIEHNSVAEAAGVFNVTQGQVTYNQNIFEKLYPASTTKILTAYIIIKNANLSDTVTVSNNAANPGQSSSVCGLNEGDQITVNDLLYGLLLSSGNDAAIALAEYYSGSVEEFAKIMTETAQSLGATNSNFVNPHGLPDDNHYTSVYDMYLIMNEAINCQDFVDIISSSSHSASYKDASGNTVEKTWNNTCQYLTKAVDAPEGITVIGAKTGTTNAAGYCLVLYSKNANNDDIISIVYKADGKSDLYLLMNEILQEYAN